MHSTFLRIGTVTTFAGLPQSGSTDGTVAFAKFDAPMGITADSSGRLYVSDMSFNIIRAITPIGSVTRLAGGGGIDGLHSGSQNGIGSNACFDGPYGLTAFNGRVFVADNNNHVIRQIVIGTTGFVVILLLLLLVVVVVVVVVLMLLCEVLLMLMILT